MISTQFIEEKQNSLLHILITGMNMNDQQIVQTFGMKECSSNVRELRLNHRCDQVQLNHPESKLHLHEKMFQNLCKLRVLDLQCVNFKSPFAENDMIKMFSNVTGLPPVIMT